MMNWRTVVSASGVMSHAFDDVPVSICGNYAARDCRPRVEGERRCKMCEHLLANEKRAAKAKQGVLPV